MKALIVTDMIDDFIKPGGACCRRLYLKYNLAQKYKIKIK